MKAILVPALITLASPALAASRCWQADWCQPAEPFRIVGKVYYVGTAGLSAFLVTDPKGHVLIDGGLPESAPLIRANIARLGFRIEDIRYLLIDHAHFDHSGGLAELKRLSGATLAARRPDAPDLEAGRALIRPEQPAVPPVKVDRLILDGETISIGATKLRVLATPGHTAGATSWTLTTRDGGKPVRVIFASSLTVAGLKLRGNPGYPAAVTDFLSSFARLKAERADVFLTFHPAKFDMAAKRQRIAAGETNAFIDPRELQRRVAAEEQAFEAELKGAAK